MKHKMEKAILTGILAASISFLVSVMSYVSIDVFIKASKHLAMKYESVEMAIHLLDKYKYNMLTVIAIVVFMYSYKHIDEIIDVKRTR